MGILPDMIMARSDYPVEPDLCQKIASNCDVSREAVIPLVTSNLLFEVPLTLEAYRAADILLERLNLPATQVPDLAQWRWIVKESLRAKPHVRIGLIGKYVELHDAYLSVREALRHAGLLYGVEVDIDWILSSDLEKPENLEKLSNLNGILVPGGFGSRGIEGKIVAAKFARENRVPYLGLCLGMQILVIEFARSVLGFTDANSSEFDPASTHPLIDLMPDQKNLKNMGGTMRLGLYPCQIQPNSKAAEAYGGPKLIMERHRHRYEVNNQYRQELLEKGLTLSGRSPDGLLVEIAEVANHPFMLGSQFHPEFLSRPTNPHPLFVAFLKAVCQQKDVVLQAGDPL